jgi:hypothetical protein
VNERAKPRASGNDPGLLPLVEAECESIRETFSIALKSLIQDSSLDAIEFRQISIKHDTLSSNRKDSFFKQYGSRFFHLTLRLRTRFCSRELITN